MIINIETDYGDTFVPRSSFPGLQHAKSLRRKGFNEPILFTSFLSLEFILNQPGSDILTTMASTFIRLPSTSADLEKTYTELPPLSAIQLKDIVRNYCDERGVFSTIFHAFKGKLRSIVYNIEKDNESKKEDAQTLFSGTAIDLKREFPYNTELIKLFEQLIYRNQLPDEDIQRWALPILEKGEQTFYDYIPQAEDDLFQINGSAKPWKVLLLDDEPESLAHLTAELSLRGIVYKLVNSAEEAQNEINNDSFNQYAVAISDYRLLEYPNGWSKPRLQKAQGYDFLIWLKNQTRYTATVALSGLGRAFLMESFRLEHVDVKVFSKNELDRGVKLFVEDIEYLGEKYFDLVCSQPQQTDWFKKTKPYYVNFRNRVDFESIEKEISKRAKAACIEIYHEIVLKETNLDSLILTSEFGNAQQDISGNADESLEKLVHKLILRRIALYCLCRGVSPDIIARLLMYGVTDREITVNNRKQVFSALHVQTATDIPYHILPEERFWLSDTMGIALFEMMNHLNQMLEIINQYLNQPEMKKLRDQIQLPIKGIDEPSFPAMSTKDLKVIIREIFNYKGKSIESNHLLDNLRGLIYDLHGLLPEENNILGLKQFIDDFYTSVSKHALR